jgi:hypothetical protein
MTLRLKIRTLTFTRSPFFRKQFHIRKFVPYMEKDVEQILKNADFKIFTKILEVAVHNFSTFLALF